MNFVYFLHDEKSSESFERVLLKIRSKYNIISVPELYSCLKNGVKLRNTCCLTVDDGWRSTYDVIFPVIKRHKIPITIFVSPESCVNGFNFWFYLYKYCDKETLMKRVIEKGFFDHKITKYSLELALKELEIDTVYSLISHNLDYNHKNKKIERGFVNIQELLEMRDSGLVTIGAHTLTHPILSNETDERSKKEIVNSITQLAKLLNQPVEYFAYPNGLPNIDFGMREIEFVKEAGIKMAFSVESNYITRNVNFYSVPRIFSEKRLDLGRLGVLLPSLSNQKGKRKEIKKLKQ